MTYEPTVGLTWVGARARDENPGTHIGYKQYHEALVLTSDSDTHLWRKWNMLQNREEKQGKIKWILKDIENLVAA